MAITIFDFSGAPLHTEQANTLVCANLARTDLRSADLTDTCLFRVNFTGADLQGARLRRADLRRANFAGAKLSDADFAGADFSAACLSDADLRRANLTVSVLQSADFRRADLTGANLEGSILSAANFRDANLTRANLIGSNLTDTDLTRVDLRGAQLPPAPVIPDIHRAMYAATSAPGALRMCKWHSSVATHSRAGWVTTMAGAAGADLEAQHGTAAAAALTYMASDPALAAVPDFYVPNAEALADMRRLAELETV